jgi:PBP1b-binding outer membrane lipoprotein LpoB
MKKVLASTISILFVFGCSSAPPPKTQLQVREFQTRVFDTKDMRQVLKACLNTLQDDGYIVRNAVPDLGLLVASKQLDVENKTQAVFAALFAGANARWAKNSETEVTVNASEYGKQIKVRANFSLKVIDNKGGVVDVKQIQDEPFYQEFFARVDKAIFLEAALEPAKSAARPEFYTGQKLYVEDGEVFGEVTKIENDHLFVNGTRANAVFVVLPKGGGVWMRLDQARGMIRAVK